MKKIYSKKSQPVLVKSRDTNKDMAIKEKLEMEGLNEENLKTRQEFKKLRDVGIKNTIME